MKRLTCEMCGSTDLIKEDGVFVCQSCGCKYSVEEAKKMMLEVSGVVEVKNAAQLENLLNLAQSSFASKNYSQAEEFCNQVIAMDDKNYTAWKLKGEAINYQISAENQRILEVYNCIMTSYRVLPDKEKQEKKTEIIESLKECLKGEVTFWLARFLTERPVPAMLERVKGAYSDSYSKLNDAFDELELSEEKQEYLTEFANSFIDDCNSACVSAWKTTVGYNYYRNYMDKGDKGIDPFGRSESDKKWVIADTSLYRPTQVIWQTFIAETDVLIALLYYAEGKFNDKTSSKSMCAIYDNIIKFERCAIPSGSWKLALGLPNLWSNQTIGWQEEYILGDANKANRESIIQICNQRKRDIPRKIQEREKAQRVIAYWNDHIEEKSRLENEQKSLEERISNISNKIEEIRRTNTPKLRDLRDKKNKRLDIEKEVEKQEGLISNLEAQRDKCGIFKGKEKKALQDRIEMQEKPKLAQLKSQAESERKQTDEKINSEIEALSNEGKELQDELSNLKMERDSIIEELTKDR